MLSLLQATYGSVYIWYGAQHVRETRKITYKVELSLSGFPFSHSGLEGKLYRTCFQTMFKHHFKEQISEMPHRSMFWHTSGFYWQLEPKHISPITYIARVHKRLRLSLNSVTSVHPFFHLPSFLSVIKLPDRLLPLLVPKMPQENWLRTGRCIWEKKGSGSRRPLFGHLVPLSTALSLWRCVASQWCLTATALGLLHALRLSGVEMSDTNISL